MNHAEELKKISAEMRPIIERQLDDAELLVPLRQWATKIGLDWGRIKALLKAQIQDERSESGGAEHVDKVIDGADTVIAYADTLGITTKMNDKNFSSEGRAPEPSTLAAGRAASALAIRRGEPSPESTSAGAERASGGEAVARLVPTHAGGIEPDRKAGLSAASPESRAKARVDATARETRKGAASETEQPSGSHDCSAERVSRLDAGRTASPGRDGNTPAPLPITAGPLSLPDKPSSVAGTAPNNVGADTPAALEPESPPTSDAAGTIFDIPADGSIPEFLRRPYPAAATAGPN